MEKGKTVEKLNRFGTERSNPMERRSRESEKAIDCEHSCPVAIRNQERIDAAFIRLDEERKLSKERSSNNEKEIKRLDCDIGARIRFTLFSWIIGTLVLIFSTITGVICGHVNDMENMTSQTIENIEKLSVENARKIDVTVTRVDDFLRSNDQYLNRSQIDQDRVLNKLEEIGNTIKKLEIEIGAMKVVKR